MFALYLSSRNSIIAPHIILRAQPEVNSLAIGQKPKTIKNVNENNGTHISYWGQAGIDTPMSEIV